MPKADMELVREVRKLRDAFLNEGFGVQPCGTGFSMDLNRATVIELLEGQEYKFSSTAQARTGTTTVLFSLSRIFRAEIDADEDFTILTIKREGI